MTLVDSTRNAARLRDNFKLPDRAAFSLECANPAYGDLVGIALTVAQESRPMLADVSGIRSATLLAQFGSPSEIMEQMTAAHNDLAVPKLG